MVQQLTWHCSSSLQRLPSWKSPWFERQLASELPEEHCLLMSQHPCLLQPRVLLQGVVVYPSWHWSWFKSSTQNSPLFAFWQQLVAAVTSELEKMKLVKMLRVITRKISKSAFSFRRLALGGELEGVFIAVWFDNVDRVRIGFSDLDFVVWIYEKIVGERIKPIVLCL